MMHPAKKILKTCLIGFAFSLALAACSGTTGTTPAGKQDPNWVETPSAQGTNWELYMDTHGGGR